MFGSTDLRTPPFALAMLPPYAVTLSLQNGMGLQRSED